MCYNRYFLRLQISDSTTTTTCTVFDDKAQRMVNTSISNLLDSLNGNCEDVPKIIQQLYEKNTYLSIQVEQPKLD